ARLPIALQTAVEPSNESLSSIGSSASNDCRRFVCLRINSTFPSIHSLVVDDCSALSKSAPNRSAPSIDENCLFSNNAHIVYCSHEDFSKQCVYARILVQFR